VQRQIASEVAGVGFSVNPLTNAYDELVFNANFGLGETVVAGLATPDLFVVDRALHTVATRTIGKKETSIWLKRDGGTEERADPRALAGEASLSEARVLALAEQLVKVEAVYGRPMDIEWAFSDGALNLLQARPITTHFALPPSMLTPPGAKQRLYWDVTISVQGLLEAISPREGGAQLAPSWLAPEVAPPPASASGLGQPGLPGLAAHMAERDAAGADLQHTERDRQLKPARADRARIEQDHTLVAAQEGHMGMAAQHDAGGMSGRLPRHLGAQLGPIYGDVDEQELEHAARPRLELHVDRVRQPRRAFIDVATHREQGRELRKPIEHAQIPDVPGVKDHARRELCDHRLCPRVGLTVCVRHDHGREVSLLRDVQHLGLV